MKTRHFALLVFGFLSCLPLIGGESELEPELPEAKTEAPKPPARDKLVIARVGSGRIDFDTVYELWEPTWRQVMLDCQLRKRNNDEANQALQKAWEKSIQAAIREEVFYREGLRELEEEIDKIAKQLSESGSGGHGGKPYAKVRRGVQMRYQEKIEERLQETIQSFAKRSGGVEPLQRALAAQGQSWESWKARLRRKFLAQRHLAMAINASQIAEPGPGEIRSYYRDHIEEFRLPGSTRFRHIFISFEKRGGEENAREAAANLYETLLGTEQGFIAAAKSHSDDAPSSAQGGLEPLPNAEKIRDALAPSRQAWLTELRETAARLQPQELGPVLLTNHGCHLIYVLDRLSGAMIPFRKAQDKIMQQLKSKKRERLTLLHYARLRREIKVEILHPRFPEKYTWEAQQRRRGTSGFGPGSLRRLMEAP